MVHPWRWLGWRPILRAVVILLVLCPAGVSPARPVLADGAPLPPLGHEADVRMPGQKAILVHDAQAGREELILSVKLFGVPEAAWVVPVPARPEVRVASAEWFSHLSDLTQPQIVTHVEVIEVDAADDIGAGTVQDEGVDLISREQVGIYDVSVLAADDPRALLDWLNENGYAFPERGEPILEAYVQEGGWHFCAARVFPGQSVQLAGDVMPLWLSFETERPVYPMRLTALVDRGLEVLLYVLTDHRVELEGFEVEYAGELTLEPVAPEDGELAERLSGRPFYVTKLRAGHFQVSGMTDDLYPHRAADDAPFRMVIHHTVFDYHVREQPFSVPAWPFLWRILLALLVILALFAGPVLVLRRRRAPPRGITNSGPPNPAPTPENKTP